MHKHTSQLGLMGATLLVFQYPELPSHNLGLLQIYVQSHHYIVHLLDHIEEINAVSKRNNIGTSKLTSILKERS